MSSILESSGFELSGELAEPTDAQNRTTGRRKLSVFVAGVALLTLFFVTQLLQLLPFLHRLPVAKIAAGFVVLVFVFSPQLLANRLRLREIPQFKYILGILAFALLTAPLS